MESSERALTVPALSFIDKAFLDALEVERVKYPINDEAARQLVMDALGAVDPSCSDAVNLLMSYRAVANTPRYIGDVQKFEHDLSAALAALKRVLSPPGAEDESLAFRREILKENADDIEAALLTLDTIHGEAAQLAAYQETVDPADGHLGSLAIRWLVVRGAALGWNYKIVAGLLLYWRFEDWRCDTFDTVKAAIESVRKHERGLKKSLPPSVDQIAK